MKLRELRKKAGLTLKAFGNEFGLSESAISQYETGKRSADFETLLKFAEFFNCTLDYLVRGDINAETEKAAKGETTFDDFTYAMHTKSTRLTDKNKNILLNLADQFIEDIEGDEEQ